MLLNRAETALVNNPVRALFQRWLAAPRLLKLGGPIQGSRALEIGCGRGVGIDLILRSFGAEQVDAFDLDSQMVALAQKRWQEQEDRIRIWQGDACQIDAPDRSYDAVFDFSVLHHVEDWRCAVTEVARVLKPGGKLYAEEGLRRLLKQPLIRSLFKHPTEDRFDAAELVRELQKKGLEVEAIRNLAGCIAWLVARKVETQST